MTEAAMSNVYTPITRRASLTCQKLPHERKWLIVKLGDYCNWLFSRSNYIEVQPLRVRPTSRSTHCSRSLDAHATLARTKIGHRFSPQQLLHRLLFPRQTTRLARRRLP